MKRFKSLWLTYRDWLQTYHKFKQKLDTKASIKYILSTIGLSLIVMILPTLLVINLLMFVTFIKVWIVYFALIGYGFIWFSYYLQVDFIKDYSNDFEFVKIRRLFHFNTLFYGFIWFSVVYVGYQLLGGYII